MTKASTTSTGRIRISGGSRGNTNPKSPWMTNGSSQTTSALCPTSSRTTSPTNAGHGVASGRCDAAPARATWRTGPRLLPCRHRERALKCRPAGSLGGRRSFGPAGRGERPARTLRCRLAAGERRLAGVRAGRRGSLPSSRGGSSWSRQFGP